MAKLTQRQQNVRGISCFVTAGIALLTSLYLINLPISYSMSRDPQLQQLGSSDSFFIPMLLLSAFCFSVFSFCMWKGYQYDIKLSGSKRNRDNAAMTDEPEIH